MRINRIIVLLFGLLFAALGIGFWVAPQTGGHYLALRPEGATGVVALQAEVGGLFLGLAALCLGGVVAGNRSFQYSAALILGAIAVGRTIGIITQGGLSDQLVSLTIELGGIAALVVNSVETTCVLKARTLGRQPR